MRVLITGGGGFIGSHLVDSQLAKGEWVRTVDLHFEHLTHVAEHQNLEIVVGDITKPALVKELLAGIDVVYHLASAHLDVSLSEDYYRQVNLDATMSLIATANSAGVKRFVHCSTVGVMGDIKTPPADETFPCNPTNIYEKTKLAGERAALQFYRETNFPISIARPAWVYGPRCPRTAKLFRTIGKGRFIIFGDGSNLRHPIYVSDAVRGLERCAAVDGAIGEVFILAGSRPVTINELIQTIAEVVGVQAPNRHMSLGLARIAGRSVEMAFKPLHRQPPFSTRSIDFFTKNNAYNTSFAKRKLDFEAQVDLRTGFEQALAWFKDNNSLN